MSGYNTMMSADGKLQYYQRQYDLLSTLLQQLNPCEIRVTDGELTCIGLRTGDADADRNTLCCTECAHLSDKGCMVKALGCKMWLCNAAVKNLLDKYPLRPRETIRLIKEIQETHRTCEFFGIHCRSRHSMKENMAGELHQEGFKASKS